MDYLLNLISQHAHVAHWYIFIGIVLAGANMPISIDMMVISAALLASQIIPENRLELYLSVLVGCLCSAWLSYWIGRLVGPKIANWPFFAKILKPEKLEKIKTFYGKYGLLTLIIGRFIPFGVRNCIFMTAGMSQTSFKAFALRDAIACPLWTTIAFYVFFTLGNNLETLSQHLKIINISLFAAFSVTVIGVIWYKKRNHAKS